MPEYYSPMYKEHEMNYDEILMKDSSNCNNYHLSHTYPSYLRYTTDHPLDIQISQLPENERNPTLNEMVEPVRNPENGYTDSYHYLPLVNEIHENAYANDYYQLSDFEEHQLIFIKKLEEYLDENFPFIVNNFLETSHDNSIPSRVENEPRSPTLYDNNPIETGNNPIETEDSLNLTQAPYLMINERSQNFEIS